MSKKKQVSKYVCTYARMYLCMYDVSMHACMYVLYTQLYVYKRTYIHTFIHTYILTSIHIKTTKMLASYFETQKCRGRGRERGRAGPWWSRWWEQESPKQSNAEMDGRTICSLILTHNKVKRSPNWKHASSATLVESHAVLVKRRLVDLQARSHSSWAGSGAHLERSGQLAVTICFNSNKHALAGPLCYWFSSNIHVLRQYPKVLLGTILFSANGSTQQHVLVSLGYQGT